MTAAATSPDAFRLRLLDGLAASITEKGYRETTVADIVRHARTSKRTLSLIHISEPTRPY